ncbi:DUF3429 domain-containing protein [Thalassotalea agarivorans]|uniref:DUF3429 domain-containing protein n=1 Tax=Thalassotalea agarivorans TaxID=349064 RepID=A0A1I0CD25_THASX|nr:DUF3429 domain-containing protein [Thalassotalea agarivorans]SET17318.1 Protein of unknown function [Thalassotalea agarivorans]
MQIHKTLGYLGLLPFLFAIAMTLTTTTLFGHSGATLFVAYSVAIACFLCGTMWLQQSHQEENKLPLYSNILTLVAATCLLLSTSLALAILTLIYLAIYVMEVRIVRFNEQASGISVIDYGVMRLTLTIIVVALHLAMQIFT